MMRLAFKQNGTSRNINLSGWKKQLTDTRDDNYRLKFHSSFFGIPQSVDNRPLCSTIEDQDALGSCTANMFAALVEANEVKRTKPNVVKAIAAASAAATVTTSNVTTAADGSITFTTKIVPQVTSVPTPPAPSPSPSAQIVQVSRLFEYYATRKIQNTISEDSGATIRDTIKAGVLYGVANEAAWPYDIKKFTVNPPQHIWTDAAKHKVTSYHAISDGDIQTMKSVLAAGYLVGFGFEVYDYFCSQGMAVNGFLNLPKAGEQVLGGHAVALVGYDDAKSAFLVRNSWGKDWGIGGYYWMHYDYVKNPRLASDFWVVKSSPVG
jgi:C1A family cysteine protease